MQLVIHSSQDVLLQDKDAFHQEDLVQPTQEPKPLVLAISEVMEIVKEQVQQMHHVLQNYAQMHFMILIYIVKDRKWGV